MRSVTASKCPTGCQRRASSVLRLLISYLWYTFALSRLGKVGLGTCEQPDREQQIFLPCHPVFFFSDSTRSGVRSRCFKRLGSHAISNTFVRLCVLSVAFQGWNSCFLVLSNRQRQPPPPPLVYSEADMMASQRVVTTTFANTFLIPETGRGRPVFKVVGPEETRKKRPHRVCVSTHVVMNWDASGDRWL